MYEIRRISRYEYSWLNSKDFHNLFAQLTDSILINDDEFRVWFKEMLNNPCFVLFGVIESKPDTPGAHLVGTGSLYIHDRYYRNRSKSAHIEDVVIDQHHRGHGLGKDLVEEMIKYAKKIGCYKVQLNCKSDMQAFYEKLDMVSQKSCMEVYF